MTLVGVFPLASALSCVTCEFFHSLPLFAGFFAISKSFQKQLSYIGFLWKPEEMEGDVFYVSTNAAYLSTIDGPSSS
jgi:hypothetical protein